MNVGNLITGNIFGVAIGWRIGRWGGGMGGRGGGSRKKGALMY